MRNKQTIRYFFSGFLSVFKFGFVKIVPPKYGDMSRYVFSVEDDINKVYRNLKDKNERN